MVKIEKGIPLPPIPRTLSYNAPKGYAELIRAMEVGDSILFPSDMMNRICQRMNSAWDSKTDDVDRSRWKYKARTVEGGIRVWRVA